MNGTPARLITHDHFQLFSFLFRGNLTIKTILPLDRQGGCHKVTGVNPDRGFPSRLGLLHAGSVRLQKRGRAAPPTAGQNPIRGAGTPTKAVAKSPRALSQTSSRENRAGRSRASPLVLLIFPPLTALSHASCRNLRPFPATVLMPPRFQRQLRGRCSARASGKARTAAAFPPPSRQEKRRQPPGPGADCQARP